MLIMSHLENKDTVKKIKAPVIISFRYIVTKRFSECDCLSMYMCVYTHICVYTHTCMLIYTFGYVYIQI